MRHWNLDDMAEEEKSLLNIWLEIIDEVEDYESTRHYLIKCLDDLLYYMEEMDFGSFKYLVEEMEIEDIETDSCVLESELNKLRSELPDIDELEENQSKLQNSFKKSFEIDTDPLIEELDDWYIEEETISDFKGRLSSQATLQADRRIFKDLKSDGTEEELTHIRSNLASKETASNYTNDQIQIIEQFLTESEIQNSKLQESIEEIFAELQSRGWRKDDLEGVIKKFATSSNTDREKKQEIFLRKIREDNDPQKCYVGLPEANLEGFTPISAGDITFHSNSDPDFDIHSRLHPKMGSMDFSSQSDIWAEGEVSGATADIKVRRLKEMVARAVDVLNLGKKAGTLQFPYDESYTVLQEVDDKILPLKANNDLSHLDYNELESRSNLEDRIDHFEDYLSGNLESPLQNSISNSIRWYRYGNRSPEEAERFLKYIISIESLLVKGKSESKQDTIAERAVEILQYIESERDSQKQLFHDFYDTRSEIVHTGARDLPELDLQIDKLESVAAQLISKCEQYTEKCESVDEVIEFIHEEEKELKRERIENSPFDISEGFHIDAKLIAGKDYEIATLELDGEFVDDGRYVFFEAEIVDGEYESGVSLNSDMEYKVDFEYEGEEYIGEDVVFLDESILDFFPTELPSSIRWYQTTSQ